MLLSICIPTYNRHKYLNNCLNSIYISKIKNKKFKFQVCISDSSKDNLSRKISKNYSSKFQIKYKKNKKKLSFAKNYIEVVKMAKGEFIWVIGDDEILKPIAFLELENIFRKNKDVDFFYINSNFLNSNYFFKYPQPFNSFLLPKKLETFSKIKKDKKVNFFDLIDQKVSWDFLLGIFQCIYKRKKFLNKLFLIDKKQINKKGVWSTLENTCFYIKIYAAAFKNSLAYIKSKPILVSSYGHKNWNNMYDFIKIVRIPELLFFYKKNGLDYFTYFKMKNFALKDFIFCFSRIFWFRKTSGLKHVDIYKHFFKNLLYPSIYLNFMKKIFIKIVVFINKLFWNKTKNLY